MSNYGKHHDLLPIAAQAKVGAHASIVPRVGLNSFGAFTWQPASSGRIKVFRFSKGMPRITLSAFYIKLSVALAEIPTHPAEEVMRDISRHVEEIVRRFDPSPTEEKVSKGKQIKAEGVTMMIKC